MGDVITLSIVKKRCYIMVEITQKLGRLVIQDCQDELKVAEHDSTFLFTIRLIDTSTTMFRINSDRSKQEVWKMALDKHLLQCPMNSASMRI